MSEGHANVSRPNGASLMDPDCVIRQIKDIDRYEECDYCGSLTETPCSSLSQASECAQMKFVVSFEKYRKAAR